MFETEFDTVPKIIKLKKYTHKIFKIFWELLTEKNHSPTKKNNK